MDKRKLLRQCLSWAAMPFAILLVVNIENLAAEFGWDDLLSTYWGAVLDVLSIVGLLVIGGAAALWGDYLLKKNQSESFEESLDPKWEEKLQTVHKKIFINETVRVDGKRFINCEFRNVTFIYNGGPFAFNNIKCGKMVVSSENPKIGRSMELLLAFGLLNTGVMRDDELIDLKEYRRRHNLNFPGTEPKSGGGDAQ